VFVPGLRLVRVERRPARRRRQQVEGEHAPPVHRLPRPRVPAVLGRRPRTVGRVRRDLSRVPRVPALEAVGVPRRHRRRRAVPLGRGPPPRPDPGPATLDEIRPPSKSSPGTNRSLSASADPLAGPLVGRVLLLGQFAGRLEFPVRPLPSVASHHDASASSTAATAASRSMPDSSWMLVTRSRNAASSTPGAAKTPRCRSGASAYDSEPCWMTASRVRYWAFPAIFRPLATMSCAGWSARK